MARGTRGHGVYFAETLLRNCFSYLGDRYRRVPIESNRIPNRIPIETSRNRRVDGDWRRVRRDGRRRGEGRVGSGEAVQQAVVPRGRGNGVVRQSELRRPHGRRRRGKALQHGVVVRRRVMMRGRGQAEEEGLRARPARTARETAAARAAVEAAVAPTRGALERVRRCRHVLAAAVEGLAAAWLRRHSLYLAPPAPALLPPS